MEDQHPGIAVAYRPALKLYAVRALQAHRLGRWLGGPQRSVTLSCRPPYPPADPLSGIRDPSPTSDERHEAHPENQREDRRTRYSRGANAARRFTRGLLFVSLSAVTGSSSDG
jgi:hypothetical protein